MTDKKCNPIQPVYFSKNLENSKTFSGSILGKVKKLRLRQNEGFFIKKMRLI